MDHFELFRIPMHPAHCLGVALALWLTVWRIAVTVQYWRITSIWLDWHRAEIASGTAKPSSFTAPRLLAYIFRACAMGGYFTLALTIVSPYFYLACALVLPVEVIVSQWFIRLSKNTRYITSNASEQAATLMAIADASPSPFYVVDTHGDATVVNQALLELIGYRQSEVVGNNMHRLIHHTRADGTPYPYDECAMYAAMGENRQTSRQSDVVFDSAGRMIEVSWVSVPVRHKDEVIGTRIELTPKNKSLAQLNTAIDNLRREKGTA